MLGVLWWGWVGYAWLTSVVDPEEGAVRLAIFAAMAGFLVVALCVPEAFGDLGLTFAVAYGVVRGAHIALFVLASRDDAGLRALRRRPGREHHHRRRPAGDRLDRRRRGPRAPCGLSALTLDMGGPLVIDPSGWRLEPGHFAERHGLIIIIALGESIVALGAAAGDGVDGGVLDRRRCIGVALSFALWWLYFDVVSYMTTRVLAEADRRPGAQRPSPATRTRSCTSRWSPAIVLVAFGLHEALAHVGDPLHREPATALVRRRRPLPARPRRVLLAERPGGEAAPPRRRRRAPGPGPARHRGRRPRRASRRDRADRRRHRLREHPLRRVAPAGPGRAGPPAPPATPELAQDDASEGP